MMLPDRWAMEPNALRAWVELLSREDAIEAAIAARGKADLAPAAPAYAVDAAGDATINLHGPIMRSRIAWLDWLGIAHVGATETSAALAQAIADPTVKRIVLDVHSPGGSIDGVPELAAAVAASSKPVIARAQSLAASAAYWIAAQASRIEVGPAATIGSIGVYTVMIDWSAAVAADGGRVHVIASSPLKGAGVSGAPISDAQLADTQRVIDSLAGVFAAAVAKGRRMSADQIAAVATGQVWIGQEAVDRQLADMVSVGSAITQSAGTARHGVAMEEKEATGEAQAPDSALLAEVETLRAAVRELTAQAQTSAQDAKQAKISGIMAAAEDRIAPAIKPFMATVALGFGDDLDGFAAFVAALPGVTHPEPTGSTPASDVPGTPQITDADRMLAKRYGVDAAKIAAARVREEVK